MADDNNTYGFSKADAEGLLPLVQQQDGEYIEGRVRGGGGSGQLSVFVTPGGGIPARSGATLGSATCTKYTVTSGTRASTATTATVYNDFTTAIGASRDIIAGRINGIWVVIAENCP